MKKHFIVIFVALLTFSFFLAACETESAQTSVSLQSTEDAINSLESSLDNPEVEFSDDTQMDDSSVSDISASGDVISETTSEEEFGENAIEVLYNSYSEKPYFAMVGTCTNGAIVTGECNGETVSSKSYEGWFSLRLKCTGNSATVTLYETVDGEQIGGRSVVKVTPKTPGSEMWPVVTGGDFQFFFQKMLPDFQGTNVPSGNVFLGMENRIKGRLNQLRQYNKNAEIIYLIVPSSMTVYPELVPETYGELAGKTRLTQAIQAINNAGAVAIDLQAIFNQHKADDMPLYYKLDSHWSDYGAYVAYQALFEHISEKFPDASPRAIDEFNWNPNYYDSGDMSFYLAMSQQSVKEYSYYRTFMFDAPNSITSIKRYRSDTSLCYSNAVTEQKTINTNRNELPSCIVFRDSYSTQLYDILAERMNETNYMGMWGFTWNQSYISSVQPDYIIYVLAEWNLDSIIYN